MCPSSSRQSFLIFKLAGQGFGLLKKFHGSTFSDRMCLGSSALTEADILCLQIPAACDSFARTYAALLSSRSQFHAAFAAHLLTLADAGLLPAERMDACLALISAPRGVA